jgi:hypothetical protein
LVSISGTVPEGNGVYLHILSREDDSGLFYLYVGQSTRTTERIRDHSNPKYRKAHSSLHYYVWDKSELNKNMKSAWVMLSAPEPKIEVSQAELNLLEMWSCLTLQTLTKNILARYLPATVMQLSFRAGCHLNVASPLNQRDQSDAPEGLGRGDLYKSDDPKLQEYYQKDGTSITNFGTQMTPS